MVTKNIKKEHINEFDTFKYAFMILKKTTAIKSIGYLLQIRGKYFSILP